MKALLLLFFILIGYTDLSAQDSTFVTVKAGYSFTEVLTPAEIYCYPQFTNGKVFFRDGSKAGAILNYSRLFQQMLFIDLNGDTLALADEKTIKFISINRDTFFYDEGYMRLITHNGDIKLAEKQIWVVADVRKMGSHNRPASTFAVTTLSNYSNTNDRAKSYDLILNEDIVLRKDTHYYFGDRYNNFVPADKKKLLQHFHKDQKSIENYLKENKVNFNNKEDLEKLSQFISQLN